MDSEECGPIKTLDEVLNWKWLKNPHLTVPLKCAENKSGPKTLICHDMKGGYLEDRFVHGVWKNGCYSFIHWSLIDVFVYFSHCLVTIPPCSWISAAHRNGTPILGTFITEWDAGFEVCDRFLNCSSTLSILCKKLVDIAVAHGFDGWLINIENKIKISQVNCLEKFLQSLTKRMHEAKPCSSIIWYDSVIENGELKWQNALNENNRNFFALCDGIFLNYNWKDEHLRKSVAEAGSRLTDVYVGVDVFGRGCLGGGGFCTNVAVQKARDFGLSVAIFAPGWVYECLEEEDFLTNQYKFWDLLLELCLIRKIRTFPFSSSFCPGFGEKIHRNGKVICSEPWYDLSVQEPQPSWFHSSNLVRICLEDAVSGGGSLQLNAIQVCSNKPHSFKIFLTHFVLDELCLVKYAFKIKSPLDVRFALALVMGSLEKKFSVLLLGGIDCLNDFLIPSDGSSARALYPEMPDSLSNIDRNDFDDSKSSWISRTYLLPLDDFRHHAIQCVEARIACNSPTDVDATVLLGYFEACYVKSKLNFRCCNIEKHVDEREVRVRGCLNWNRPSDVHFCDVYYQVENKSEVYLNSTSQQFLNVEFVLGEGSRSVQFMLLPNGKVQDKQLLTIDL